VPTLWDEWGLGETSIPPGAYQLHVTTPGHRDGEEVRVLLGEELLPGLMKGTVGPDFRLTPLRWPRTTVVRLTPPLTDDERGPFHQRRLQEWSHTLPVDDSLVYLQSYTGTSATDSQRAIHDELRRTRPELTTAWAVAAPSVPVPEGGVPVLMHTREWYRDLGSAKYLVNNIDFDRWYRKKPEQRFLQTFHGYPAKSMGIRMWRAKKFTPRHIEAELDRTSRDWDLILTPAPEMDDYYRTEYAYDGPILSHGYPRDDVLVSDEAAAVRERTRRLLGIQDHQTVVLYAPTWRDDMAISYSSSALVTYLDLGVTSEALGDDYVLLMRGHRFHANSEPPAGSARMVDVTHYPEINDLIVASDAAVLDYSSLRFDFALTGRPMVFLVPDLDRYAGGARGFLFPFEDSAPGPLVRRTEEVIALLRDLDRVRKDHHDAYEAFNATYNYLQDGRSTEHVVRAFFTEDP
jgi:CDP-glycerol glycerophosphotransferase